VNYPFDKTKLPKGLSYPLKRSALDAALENAGVSQIHVVYFWTRESGNVVMRAEFCGESKKGWFAAGQSSITLYAVPSIERKETETLLIKEGLPKLCEWLKHAEDAGNTWRDKTHNLKIECANGKLYFTEF
jgi:hypothetical protein